MHINKVEICGVNTSELPVLKNSEMRILFDRIHKVITMLEKNLSKVIYD